ncbi:hypothetical protein [Morganella morganii]|uniref:hypothetical protein n=1 Tax=Morganella morganii TaxID=582 RepID=UPI000F468492|nr:hypothetical protein [Morganella morganii]ROJ30776.1 hypothetical protein BFD15_00785 [Morganella morganii]
MELIMTFHCKEEAEIAYSALSGEKRLASERDDGVTIYNLFGNINWRNLYTLNMYNLKELEILVKQKGKDKKYHQGRHLEIIQSLQKAADINNLIIPSHWLP